MTALSLLAVQADLESDTPITIRPTGVRWVLLLGGTDARIALYGRETELRRLAAAILAGLPEAGEQP